MKKDNGKKRTALCNKTCYVNWSKTRGTLGKKTTEKRKKIGNNQTERAK